MLKNILVENILYGLLNKEWILSKYGKFMFLRNIIPTLFYVIIWCTILFSLVVFYYQIWPIYITDKKPMLSLQNVFLLMFSNPRRCQREYPALENLLIFWDIFSIRIRIKKNTAGNHVSCYKDRNRRVTLAESFEPIETSWKLMAGFEICAREACALRLHYAVMFSQLLRASLISVSWSSLFKIWIYFHCLLFIFSATGSAAPVNLHLHDWT